ncbi:MAG TPA: efflux RND transporter periplasmic adaptor subunit [Terriglobales bacterium]|jgi:HlyD family secretion protein|nr:efflux RND transporter periplasmic adaptor subunit [Terriglobales bacterium]
MSTGKKILVGSGVAIVVLAIAGIASYQSRKGVVTVQTGKVAREDLASVVSASGEIRPKTYVNIGANAFGKITRLYVKEGDRVRKGQLLAQLENVQSSADVNATQASLEAAQTDSVAAAAALNTSAADLNRAQSDYERAQLDWTRAQGLYKDALIAKSEFDSQKAAWQTAQAGLAQAQARVAQAKAQKDSADRHIAQNRANLTHAADVLQKTTYAAPYAGMITNLPVREGETVVIGIQNSPGSTLMTLADMSVITAEVKVDETDIVNVRLGQPAEVSIDAIPKKTFKAVVTEIGNNAIVRSTGVSTSQQTSASQEAKDFKVVVTLQDPPENLRPGLSATAKITTATRNAALAIPIQSLTVRTRADLKTDNGEKDAVEAAAPQTGASNPAAADREEIQGVFVIRQGKAQFLPVQTGITGTTDIEVLNGLKPGDEIVTGSYKVLRTLRPGTSVKVDNTAPKKEEEGT